MRTKDNFMREQGNKEPPYTTLPSGGPRDIMYFRHIKIVSILNGHDDNATQSTQRQHFEILGVSEKKHPTFIRDSSENKISYQFEAYHLKVQSIFFPIIPRLGGLIEFFIAKSFRKFQNVFVSIWPISNAGK